MYLSLNFSFVIFFLIISNTYSTRKSELLKILEDPSVCVCLGIYIYIDSDHVINGILQSSDLGEVLSKWSYIGLSCMTRHRNHDCFRNHYHYRIYVAYFKRILEHALSSL